MASDGDPVLRYMGCPTFSNHTVPLEMPRAKVRERDDRLLPTTRQCQGRSAEPPETLSCTRHRPLHRIRNVVVALSVRWVGLATVDLAAEEIMVTVRPAVITRDEVLAVHRRAGEVIVTVREKP